MFLSNRSYMLNSLAAVFLFIYSDAIIASQMYRDEWNWFKQMEDKKRMFDEDGDQDLARIQADIDIYKKLSPIQRVARCMFFKFDLVIVTQENMPQLYEYITTLCKKCSVTMPPVFITRQKGFFNAFASKILMSTGIIVIGQKLLNEVSDAELEAVLAHEVGHIKHNHINKTLGVIVPSTIAGIFIARYCISKSTFAHFINDFIDVIDEDINVKVRREVIIRIKCLIYFLVVFGLNTLSLGAFIGKRFEKEADCCAFECGNAEGLKQFFERFEGKRADREAQYVVTEALLQQNKSLLSRQDYSSLMSKFYWKKCFYKIGQWIYDNTPFGSHPSPRARIEAAQKYLDAHQ